jgi:predicted short-subunit dehydrogenase-like oxidoreductase (DUF2520 family)
MARTSLPRVTVVGAGKVGTAFTLALAGAGYPISAVISRTGRDALRLAKMVKVSRASTSISDIPAATDVLLLAVRDQELRETARQISLLKNINFKRVFAFHASGVLSCQVLDALKRKGALTSSIHPIQTFPDGQTASQLRNRLQHSFFGIEGSPGALERAALLVRNIGGREVIIRSDMKPLYHAACVFASSYLVVLLHAISELHRALDLRVHWSELYGPLLTGAMENALKSGPSSAVTGPVVRKDMEALQLHFDALRDHSPDLLPLYMTAAMEVARIAQGSGALTNDDVDDLKIRFRELLRSLPPSKPGKERR